MVVCTSFGNPRGGEGSGQKGITELTCGVYEGGVELFGEQRVRHVPQELFQQCCHVMDAVFLIHLDVNAAVKLLT